MKNYIYKQRAWLFVFSVLTSTVLSASVLSEGEHEMRFDKTIVYDNPDKSPVYWGGTSRSVDAYASDYCVFIDIIYEDGSATWGKWAKWTGGTHDWEKTSNVFFPLKPVKKIILAAFLRGGEGKMVVKDVFLDRTLPPDGTVLSVQRRTNLPFSDEDEIIECYLDGNKVSERVRTETPSSFRAENEPLAQSFELWPADSMRIVTPLDFPTEEERSIRDVSLELARGEREGVQICLTAGKGLALDDVELDVFGLERSGKSPFPGCIYWERVGYVPLSHSYHHHPASRHVGMKWVPDPLLPAAPMKLRKGGTQGVLLTFHADRSAKAGVYECVVRARSGGRLLKDSLRISVRVRDFALPKTFGLKTGFAMMDGFLRKLYPDDFRNRKRAAWDVMLDHRLNPDDITRTSPPEINDLLYARGRGMNYFTVQNIVRPKPEQPWTLHTPPSELFTGKFYTWFTNSLFGYVTELRRCGLDKYAALYGFDECQKEYYDGIAEFCPKLKRDLKLPIITSAMLYRDMVSGSLASNSVEALSVDQYVPLTQVYRAGFTDWLRSQGKEVWWYVCCVPLHPFANFSSLEYPPLEARVLAWQSYQNGVDGFLYWAVNFWDRIDRPLDEGDTFFPNVDTWRNSDTPGDGVLVYPGKEHILPGLRFASVRDGVEDYEWLQLAGRKDEAETIKVVGQMTPNLTKWERSPSSFRAFRSRIGDIIEREIAGPYPEKTFAIRKQATLDKMR